MDFRDEQERDWYHRFKRPGVTATVIVLNDDDDVLVIKRAGETACSGMWAFPGGFIETDKETIEQCAVRELFEETGLHANIDSLSLLTTCTDPKTDPRMHTVNIVFCYKFYEKTPAIKLDLNEVSEYRWVDPYDFIFEDNIAFDHNELTKKLVNNVAVYNGLNKCYT